MTPFSRPLNIFFLQICHFCFVIFLRAKSTTVIKIDDTPRRHFDVHRVEGHLPFHWKRVCNAQNQGLDLLFGTVSERWKQERQPAYCDKTQFEPGKRMALSLNFPFKVYPNNQNGKEKSRGCWLKKNPATEKWESGKLWLFAYLFYFSLALATQKNS